MPGTPTPNYSWPLPALTDPPDGPAQMAALGNAIDATVKGIEVRPAVQVRQLVAQSIPSAGGVLTFDTEDVDTHGMHSTSSQTSRLTAVVAGWYMLWGSVSFVSGTTARRGAFWNLNGVTFSSMLTVPMPSSVTQFNAPVVMVRLNVTDYVELFAFQDSGAAISTTVGSPGNRPWAGALWMSPY